MKGAGWHLMSLVNFVHLRNPASIDSAESITVETVKTCIFVETVKAQLIFFFF